MNSINTHLITLIIFNLSMFIMPPMVRVLVKGFTELYPEEVLWMLFKPFGTVNSIKTKELRVIVDYSSRDGAEKAMCNLQFRKLHNSSVLALDLFYNPEKRVAIRNVHPAERVEKAMEWFGRIYNVKETPGHIYVDYYDAAAARRALEYLLVVKGDDEIVFTRNILAGSSRGRWNRSKAESRTENAGSINEEGNKEVLRITRMHSSVVNDCQSLFLYNLSKKISEGDLYDLFGKYGEIISCGVRGKRGFINFMCKEAALRAFKYMNGKVIRNSRIRLKIKNG